MTAVTEQDGDFQIHDDAALRRRSMMLIVAALLLIVISAPVVLWYRAATSSAAFADAEVLEKNRLGAATLDIEVGEDAAAFMASNLAPGDVVSGHLELVNAGTLPLIYEVRGVSDGDPLAQWIRFEVWQPAADCSTQDTTTRLATDLIFGPAQSSAGSVSPPAVSDGTLAVGQRQVVCLGARLLLEAPNDVQGRITNIDLIIDAVHDIDASTTGEGQ